MESTAHCNIDIVEIQRRLFIGYLGFGLTIVVLFIIYFAKLSPLFVFPFAFMSAIGFVQAKLKYCASVAIREVLANPSKFKDEIFYILKVLFISTLLSFGFTIITVLVSIYFN